VTLTIRFWGVRGSIPSPGPSTAGVGGNTSCVEVRCGATTCILDAGTGLRRLGDSLIGRGQPVEAHMLFSHVHWDHIQGLPFFQPLYQPSSTLHLYGSPSGGSLRQVLGAQMRPPSFPVDLDHTPARLHFHEAPASAPVRIGDISVTSASLNHPDGVTAYRLECGGRSVVYATDTEHYADGHIDSDLVELARDADILIYDAQYTPDEYCGRVGIPRLGWGHSTWEEGVRVARAADVKKLLLFHHEPSHDDDTVAKIEARAAELLPGTTAAREGLTIALSTQDATYAACA